MHGFPTPWITDTGRQGLINNLSPGCTFHNLYHNSSILHTSHVTCSVSCVVLRIFPFTMLASYSWFFCIFYLVTSVLWKNEYLKWNVWHSTVFCLIYYVTMCMVCINQNIFQNKVNIRYYVNVCIFINTL